MVTVHWRTSPSVHLMTISISIPTIQLQQRLNRLYNVGWILRDLQGGSSLIFRMQALYPAYPYTLVLSSIMIERTMITTIFSHTMHRRFTTVSLRSLMSCGTQRHCGGHRDRCRFGCRCDAVLCVDGQCWSGRFAIDTTTGEITVANGALLDFAGTSWNERPLQQWSWLMAAPSPSTNVGCSPLAAASRQLFVARRPMAFGGAPHGCCPILAASIEASAFSALV